MDKRKIKSALHNYHWMVKTIVLKRKEMSKEAGDNITAKYGIQASLPKPQGNNSDPVYFEYLRREEEWKDVEKLSKTVRFIQSRVYHLQDEKEKTILNRILDGMSLRAISRELGMSHTHVRSVRDSIIDKFHEFPKSADVPKQTELQEGECMLT